ALGHAVARAEERREDVVVLPVAVLDVVEVGIATLHDLLAVAADEGDVLAREPPCRERLEDRLEHRPPEDVDEGLRDVVGEVTKTASAAGSDDDRAHDDSSPETRRSASPVVADRACTTG